MKAVRLMSFVYYLLLIIVLLYIISGFINWDRIWHNKNDLENIDMHEVSDTDIKKKRKKKFKYDVPKDDIQLKKGQVEPNSENNIDYESFKIIVGTKEFISAFKKSLSISYKEKKIIYGKLALKAKSNLRKKGFLDLDSNQSRLAKEIEEITNILETIDYRIKTLTESNIRKDFNDIINDSTHGFDSLVGRKDIKDMISKRIYTFAKNPLVFVKGFQNMAIYGKSGVGKTKLAETIGWIYAKSGILIRRKFRKVSKQEFTSSYVDESSALTRGVIMSCLEGVLFIDEAYGLTPPSGILGNIGGSHKEEAIIELVNVLDIYRGLGIVIAGGYEDKMENQFMTSNEGMKRRFPTVIRLKDYNGEQLTDLLIDFLMDTAPSIDITQKDANYIYSIILRLNNNLVFDRQAGDMQNMAAEIINSMYGSYVSWGTSFDKNCLIVKGGVNMFLKNKGRHEYVD